MASTGWTIIGWSVVGLVGLLGAGGIALGVLGMTGWRTETRFECDRATGVCRARFPLATHEVKLADITGVELKSADHGLGRGGRVETQHAIVLALKDGERSITEWTADSETVAGYRATLKEIERFLAGGDPTYSVRFDSRDSKSRSVQWVAEGVLVLIVDLVVAYFVLIRRRH